MCLWQVKLCDPLAVHNMALYKSIRNFTLNKASILCEVPVLFSSLCTLSRPGLVAYIW